MFLYNDVLLYLPSIDVIHVRLILLDNRILTFYTTVMQFSLGESNLLGMKQSSSLILKYFENSIQILLKHIFIEIRIYLLLLLLFSLYRYIF